MKKLLLPLAGLALTILMTVPALADGINARVTSVDVAAHTLTVIEGGKNYTFVTTDTTQFVDAQGHALATGLQTGDLKPGARLSITYHREHDQSLASQVKLRDVNRA